MTRGAANLPPPAAEPSAPRAPLPPAVVVRVSIQATSWEFLKQHVKVSSKCQSSTRFLEFPVCFDATISHNKNSPDELHCSQ